MEKSMRDKKMLISAILITTAMLFAGGCGKQAEPISAEPITSPTVEPEESMERSIDDTVMYATANCNIRSGAGDSETEKPAQTEKPVQTAPESVHEQTWKEHTATSQTRVPNIVVIDDYRPWTLICLFVIVVLKQIAEIL